MKSKILILVVIAVMTLVGYSGAAIIPYDDGNVIMPSAIQVVPAFRELPATNANVVSLLDTILKSENIYGKKYDTDTVVLKELSEVLHNLGKDATVKVDFRLATPSVDKAVKYGESKLLVTIEVPSLRTPFAKEKEPQKITLAFDLNDRNVANEIKTRLVLIDKLTAKQSREEANVLLLKTVNSLLHTVTVNLPEKVEFTGIVRPRFINKGK